MPDEGLEDGEEYDAIFEKAINQKAINASAAAAITSDEQPTAKIGPVGLSTDIDDWEIGEEEAIDFGLSYQRGLQRR